MATLAESALRPLFLTVDEIEPGRYLWLIVESGRQAAGAAVSSSQLTYGTYGDALDAGVAELKRYSAGNLLVGPREGDEDLYPAAQSPSGYHTLPG